MSVSVRIAGQHTFTISFTSNYWTQPVMSCSQSLCKPFLNRKTMFYTIVVCYWLKNGGSWIGKQLGKTGAFGFEFQLHSSVFLKTLHLLFSSGNIFNLE